MHISKSMEVRIENQNKHRDELDTLAFTLYLCRDYVHEKEREQCSFHRPYSDLYRLSNKSCIHQMERNTHMQDTIYCTKAVFLLACIAGQLCILTMYIAYYMHNTYCASSTLVEWVLGVSCLSLQSKVFKLPILNSRDNSSVKSGSLPLFNVIAWVYQFCGCCIENIYPVLN